MSSKYSDELISEVTDHMGTDSLDITVEELLDFYRSLTPVEIADIIAAYIMIAKEEAMEPMGPLPQSASWLAEEGYFNMELFSQDKQYAIGKRLLAHANSRVRETGIQAILQGAFTAPEDEFVQLVVDFIFNPDDVNVDFMYVILSSDHVPGEGVPVRAHLRLLPYLMRALQIEEREERSFKRGSAASK